MIYYTGRFLQFLGLAAMPAAMWIAEFRHDERGAITVFCASGLIFLAGLFLTRAVRPKA